MALLGTPSDAVWFPPARGILRRVLGIHVEEDVPVQHRTPGPGTFDADAGLHGFLEGVSVTSPVQGSE